MDAKWWNPLVLLVIAGLLAAHLCAGGARDVRAQGYTQYIVVHSDPLKLDKDINAKAKQGWRVVTMTVAHPTEQCSYWVIMGK